MVKGFRRFQAVLDTTTVVFRSLHSNQTRYTKKGFKATCAGFDNTNTTTPERRWASRSQCLRYAIRTACLVVRTVFRATDGTKNEDQVTPPGPTTYCHMLKNAGRPKVCIIQFQLYDSQVRFPVSSYDLLSHAKKTSGKIRFLLLRTTYLSHAKR